MRRKEGGEILINGLDYYRLMDEYTNDIPISNFHVASWIRFGFSMLKDKFEEIFT